MDLLGLSLGGAVAMRLAADHPARVRRLVLANTWGLPHRDFLVMMLHRVSLLERGDVKGYADLAIGQVHSEAYLARHPEAIDAYRARVAQADASSLRAAIGACMGHDMRHDLARITAPTLVLAGREDRLTPPWYSEHLARVIPAATLVIVEGSAHFPHLEAPEAFLKVVGSFLQ